VTHDGRLSVLELFHGPTAAFKDFGARFLAANMQRLRAKATRPLNILVATSGDTGGAVAAAFHRRPGIEVSVLFPKGLVSPTQERQLTCWGDNVHSFRVNGSFDDCQRLVKDAFLNPGLRQRFELSSANSINLGRLLPQAVYYAATSIAVYRRHGVVPNFVIPSGNLGNSVACVWARKLGLPIGRIVLAFNANRTVPDFLQSAETAFDSNPDYQAQQRKIRQEDIRVAYAKNQRLPQLDRAAIRKQFEKRFTARRMALDYLAAYRSLTEAQAPRIKLVSSAE